MKNFSNALIKAIIEFVYQLFNTFNIPKHEEVEFRNDFHEYIPSKLYKDKNKADLEF